jgi:hypothetical protein
MSLNTACALAATLLTIFMREALRRANKKLDLAGEAVGIEAQVPGRPDDEERPPLARTYRYVT